MNTKLEGDLGYAKAAKPGVARKVVDDGGSREGTMDQ